jgi:hypothetical protein
MLLRNRGSMLLRAHNQKPPEKVVQTASFEFRRVRNAGREHAGTARKVAEIVSGGGEHE